MLTTDEALALLMRLYSRAKKRGDDEAANALSLLMTPAVCRDLQDEVNTELRLRS